MIPRDCQWVLSDPNEPGSIVQCGLLHGHDGDHVPFLPGDYLASSLAHPLDVYLFWASRSRCFAGCPMNYVDWETTLFVRSGDGWSCTEEAVFWRFGPCGHEFRERLDGDGVS